MALLKKAGIDVGEGVVLQFYPKQVEAMLAQLEVRYRGRQPAEIRVTRFGVVPRGDGYGFEVLAQETAALTHRSLRLIRLRLTRDRTGRSRMLKSHDGQVGHGPGG